MYFASRAVGADAVAAKPSDALGTVIAVVAAAGIVWLLLKMPFGAAPAKKKSYARVPGILGSRRYE